MNRDEIILHAKSNTSGRGIFTASRYLSDIAGCLSGGACPADIMKFTTPDEWTKVLEQSTGVLTATDSEWGFDEKSFTTEKGYILVASGIMSTSKMDSDRDILEAKGCELEAVCPYLWHHIMVQPVGKVLGHTLSTVKSGEKDLDAVLFKCGIADVGNGLGRDTALLIEMGGIRNSHGFEPLEAKPIKGAGWHVTKYRTFEISAVTVPANSDAVFTEFSKEKTKFRSDLVKDWIKGHYDTRQKTWTGWKAPTTVPVTGIVEIDEDSGEATASIQIGDTEPIQVAKAQLKTVEGACSCGTKTLTITEEQTTPALAEPIKAEKFYLPGLPGSWEHIQSDLRKSARKYIRQYMLDSCGCYGGYIESTFKDHVILCVYTDEGECYYKVSWGMVDGKASLTGDFSEVEISFTATITEEDSDESEKTADIPDTKIHTETFSHPENSEPVHVRVIDPVLASLGL